MPIEVRRAVPSDKPRMLEISAQIWEGDDYVPAVADQWLADESGLLAMAELEGEVIGFARISWPLPGFAWMEGMRTEPGKENRGAGKAVTRYLLDEARRRGSQVAALSTYVENYASLHIIESYGFTRVAEFVNLEAGPGSTPRQAAEPATDVVEVPAGEALAFVRDSAFLSLSQGYLPHGWHFFPFALGPEQAMAEMQYLLGIRRGKRLAALVGCGRPLHGTGSLSIDFADGEPEDLMMLLRHVLYLGRDAGWVYGRQPSWLGQTLPALAVFRELGFSTLHDFKPEVFVYSQLLPGAQNRIALP
jgi:GNAT superfamily N-acetyltransferase